MALSNDPVTLQQTANLPAFIVSNDWPSVDATNFNALITSATVSHHIQVPVYDVGVTT